MTNTTTLVFVSPCRSIRWDDPTIAEHDKERGTRMKVEEPKTPFHRETVGHYTAASACQLDIY